MGTLALNLDIVPGQKAKPCLSQAWGGEGGLLGLSWGQQPEPTPCLCEGLRADGRVGPGLTPVQFLLLVGQLGNPAQPPELKPLLSNPGRAWSQ